MLSWPVADGCKHAVPIVWTWDSNSSTRRKKIQQISNVVEFECKRRHIPSNDDDVDKDANDEDDIPPESAAAVSCAGWLVEMNVTRCHM